MIEYTSVGGIKHSIFGRFNFVIFRRTNNRNQWNSNYLVEKLDSGLSSLHDYERANPRLALGCPLAGITSVGLRLRMHVPNIALYFAGRLL